MFEPSQVPSPQRSIAQISPCGPISMPAVVPQGLPSASLAHWRCGGPNGSGRVFGIAICAKAGVAPQHTTAIIIARRKFMRAPFFGPDPTRAKRWAQYQRRIPSVSAPHTILHLLEASLAVFALGILGIAGAQAVLYLLEGAGYVFAVEFRMGRPGRSVAGIAQMNYGAAHPAFEFRAVTLAQVLQPILERSGARDFRIVCLFNLPDAFAVQLHTGVGKIFAVAHGSPVAQGSIKRRILEPGIVGDLGRGARDLEGVKQPIFLRQAQQFGIIEFGDARGLAVSGDVFTIQPDSDMC